MISTPKQDNESSTSNITNLNPNLSQVSFQVKYETSFGQSVYIVGNIEELGSWEPSKGVALSTTPEKYPIWKSEFDLICPVGMEIDYKYLVKDNNNCYWEALPKGQNRHIIINTPGKFIVYDEKGSLISQIRSVNNNFFSNLITNSSSNNYNNNNNNSNTYTYSGAYTNSNIYSGNASPTISSFQKENFSLDLDSKLSESEIQDIISYENNQLADEFQSEVSFVKNNTKLTPEDAIIIASTNLPFEVIRNPHPKGTEDKYIISESDYKLIYLILFGMKEKRFCNVKWVGMLKNAEEYSNEELEEISQFLRENNIFMVNVPEKDIKNYWIYVNSIMCPIFVESAVDTKNEYFLNYEKYFTAFQNVNRIFGDLIYSIMSESDLIMINDISLALIPNILIQKNVNSRIGIYFHICFPPSEIFRIFPNQTELLRSILLCDVIGFHIFRYARNFLVTLNQELGINYEVRVKGDLMFNYLGRDVLVHIMHAGIDLDYIHSLTTTDKFQEAINKYKPIVENKFSLVSIDNPLEVNLILVKLEAYKSYLAKYPELKNKFVMVQMITHEKMNNKTTLPLVQKLANEIKTAFGEGCLYIEDIDNITLREQFALFSLCNVLLIMQMWNGLCTLANQFISLQSNDKPYGLIVSEGVGVSPALQSCLKVNPFNKADVIKAIETVYTMSNAERKQKYEHDMNFIKKNSTFSWIQSFFIDLKKVSNNQLGTKIGLGIGLNFKLMKLNSNFTHLNYSQLFTSYLQSNNRLFFLDYENTLQSADDDDSFSNTNLNSNTENLRPNRKLIGILNNLTKDPKNQVYIINSRKKEFFTKFFKEVSNLGFGAEYGFFYKTPKEKDYSKFETLITVKDWSWRDTVIKILQGFTQKTQGSYYVVKEATVSWIYKNCDSYFGHLQADELISHLNNIFGSFNSKIEIVKGKSFVEIKPRNINKGYFISNIIQREFQEGNEPDFVLAIGDDAGDEEMFKYLISVENQLRRIGKDITTYGVTVGKVPSNAKYYLNEVNEILLYLDSLTHKIN